MRKQRPQTNRLLPRHVRVIDDKRWFVLDSGAQRFADDFACAFQSAAGDVIVANTVLAALRNQVRRETRFRSRVDETLAD